MKTKGSSEMTTEEVAQRFNELAQQEKWFEIHDELFAEDVKSIEPSGSIYFNNAEGKQAVRTKGEDIVKRVKAFYGASTTAPIVAGDHFAVGRQLDIELDGHGRINMKEIMLYNVRKGKITLEQFFY